MRRKSTSEHKFSGVSCNFKVFQAIFPGANKIQGFSGSSRVFWSPCYSKALLLTVLGRHHCIYKKRTLKYERKSQIEPGQDARDDHSRSRGKEWLELLRTEG